MRFFIDTVSLNQIKKVQDLGVIRDVIKPESLMSKENISEFRKIKNGKG